MASFAGTERYQIIRRLGAGGMGVVYEAYDRQRGQRVALKTLSFEDPGAIYRLKREFRALSDVAHPNLISLHELVRDEDTWFFTMELIDGENFLEHVRPGQRTTAPIVSEPKSDEVAGGLDVNRLRSVLTQLVEGVNHLHEAGKWHRDLKPENVLVREDGRVVLLDFGISAEAKLEGPGTLATGAMGTAAYMAPEQIDVGQSTPASDWYALGVMLYEALTGDVPFSGSSLSVIGRKMFEDPAPPEEIVPDAPADLVALCKALLVREPEDRPSGMEVLQRLGQAHPRVRTSSPRRRLVSAVMGRELHVTVLQEEFEKARGGAAVSVYVQGLSGIGKTTLVEHFLEQLDERYQAVVLSGRCYPRESMPYKAVDGVIDSLTRYLRSLPEEEVRELLPREILFLTRVFPVLEKVGEDLDFRYPQPEVPDALELRKRAFSALRRLLWAVAQRRPVIVYVDDLQWTDADSVALLQDLMRPPTAPPIMLVCAFRSEEVDTSPYLRSLLELGSGGETRDLMVGPLGEEDATELARLIMRSDNNEPLLHSIVEEAAGSPFVLEQLARHAAQSENGEMRETNLAVMLDARIDRMPSGSRELLDTLAVAQRPVDFEVAHRAAGVTGDARALVTSLEVNHLVRPSATADMIETYHDRIRETLAARISQEHRVQIHQRLADSMVRGGFDDPEALFEHYRGAGRTAQAAQQAEKAADRAMEALAFDRAASFYREAIHLHPPDSSVSRKLTAGLGEALANAGRPADAADAFILASGQADPALALELRRRAAEQLLFGGHTDRGMQVTRDLLRTVGLRIPATRTKALLGALLRKIQLRMRGLKYVERKAEEIPVADLLKMDVCGGVGVGLTLVDTVVAFDLVTQHLLMALKAGEITRVSRGMSWESGFIAIGGGRSRKQTELLIGEAGRLAERLGTPRELALSGVTQGAAALLCGEFKRAVGILLGAEQMLREQCTGMMWELTTSQSFLLSSLIYLGELAEVSARLSLMLADALERGNLLAATEARTRGNFGWLAMGDPARARFEIQEALRTWSHSGFHRQHYNALISNANIDLYEGDPGAAWKRVEDQWGPLKRSLLLQGQVLRAESHFLRGRCALAVAAQGSDRKRLLRIAKRHAAKLARERMPWIAPFAPLLRAGISSIVGDNERARTLLSAAAEGFEGAELRLYAAAARRRLGQLTGGTEGERLIQQADEAMRSEQIPRPDRVTEVLAPGFLIKT